MNIFREKQSDFFTPESVVQAVYILFHANQQSTNEEKKQADEFLRQYGKSYQAWNISIQILSQFTNQDNMMIFQMSRFLKMKWQYDYGKYFYFITQVTLQHQQVNELQTQTLTIVKHYAQSKDRAIRIQMALILIYVYMQTFDQWGDKNILTFLVEELHFDTFNFTSIFGFDVLENWPQEILQNDTIVMDEQKRNQLTQLVKKQSLSRVFDFLKNYWSVSDNTGKYRILGCYTKWLSFMKNLLIQEELLLFLFTLNQCPVFTGALQLLKDEELQERAMQLVSQAIKLIPKNIINRLLIGQNQDQSLFTLNQFVQNILDATYLTFPQCIISIKDELSDEIHLYVKFYSRIAKKFIHQILLLQQLTQPFLEISLSLFQSEQTDEDSVDMRILWCSFFNGLYIYQMEYPDLFKQWQQQSGTFLSLFMEASVKKCLVSTDFLINYSTHNQNQQRGQNQDAIVLDDDELIEQINEEYEIKKATRDEIKQIIESMTIAINPKKILIQLAAYIKGVSGIFQNQEEEFQNLQKDVQISWAQFEACIFLTNTIVPAILASEDIEGKSYLVEIMNIYLKLNQFNSFIVKTTLQTIIEGGSTLLQIQKNLVQRVFDYVYFYIQYPQKSVQKQATLAFLKTCQSNHNFIIENIQIFITMVKKLQNMYLLYLVDNIIIGIAGAVCKQNETILLYFVPLCSVFANNLVVLKLELEELIKNDCGNQLSVDQLKSHNKSLFKNIIKNLDALTMTINEIPQDEDQTYLQVHTLVVQTYKELWPILSFLVEYASKIDENIAEKVVRLTKHTWRCTFKSFDVLLLTQVLQKFIECYKNKPLSSYIYSIEIIATVYSKYEDYHQVLLDAFEMICEITFSYLTSLESIESNPDLSEDFFGMLQRYGRYSPELLLKSRSLDQIFQLSQKGIGVQHHNAAKSIYGWLETLCKMCSKNKEAIFRSELPQNLIQILKQKLTILLPQILSQLFGLIKVGISDEEVASYIFDVIGSMAKIEEIEFQQIIQVFLDGFQSTVLTKNEKDEWLRLLR